MNKMIRLDFNLLHLKYDETSFILYMNDVPLTPSVRKLIELSDLAYDKDFIKSVDGMRVLYYMYRDVCHKEDKSIFESRKLRHDITFIPPFNIGKEYVKTSGHYHPNAVDELSYPEIYEIISGKAHYILQRPQGKKIIDVLLLEAKKGDKIVIPPNYGHITMNPSQELLVMANIVSSQFQSLYEPIKEKGGGAYFELLGHEYVKNRNYRDLPEIRFHKAAESAYFPQDKNLYSLFQQNPTLFDFLNFPEKTEEILPLNMDFR